MTQSKVGIALSGGGKKGAAHIGAIKLFNELGIQPYAYSGSSAGAIVGALAAANYSIEDMLQFFKSMSLLKASNFAWRKPGFINTNNFEAILKEFFPNDSFEALSKKLFVSVTDITYGKSKVFSSGPLIKVLMASSAFPVVFSPIKMDGSLYADGAILNNFPIEPLQEICDKIIGINVHQRTKIDNSKLTSSFKIFKRAYEIAIHYNNFEKYKECDVVIATNDLKKFNSLRTNQIDEIFQIGYEKAMEQKEKLLQL